MRAIYYDTETTGVKAERDRIIEIAAYDPVEDRTFEMLINPGIPIPPDATAIHHITNEMVAEAPTFAQVGMQFTQFCEGDVVLIAHNNDAFDVHFLRHEFKRHNIELPAYKFIDSLKWARRFRPDLPRHSLQFLREVFGLTANNAHRALDDVIILHQVFSQMIDDLPISEVYRLLNIPRTLHHMPFGKHQGVPLNKVPSDYVKWLEGTGAFEKPDNAELRQCFEKLGLLATAKV
jgi:DNA polymerase-3 subunit epsilon